MFNEIIYNWDIIRQVICGIAAVPLVYWFWKDEIHYLIQKLNSKKEAA